MWDRATPDQITEGRTWYARAFVLANQVSEIADISLDRAACVISALSPRTKWERNVVAALAIARGEPVSGTLPMNIERAQRAMTVDDPWSVFSPQTPKIHSFAKNILGDTTAVTVDMWASLVAGVTETEMGRVGVYEAVAEAYRRAAALREVAPPVMQAGTWVVVRPTPRNSKTFEYAQL
ncbi:hypothetical protein OG563_26635 [Nocardia vinacea]|uniref:Uncharacterized protein n=1 Tax=Nocardia vinacea TaxID=96468 RepID=A0ABZ1YIF2_9NOCA|nr:hypothetical protein [Nocardia vinacea]